MKNIFKRTMLLALVAALAVASLPFVSVSAQGANDPTPPAGEVSNEKLEQAWARQLKAYERMGKTDEFVAKAQQLIDRASAKGKDVSAVQAALDAFVESTKDAKPVYESAKGIINSHQGFDANGKVTNAEQAKATVEQMRTKMQEIKSTMNGTFKALLEEMKAFREANKPAEPKTDRDS